MPATNTAPGNPVSRSKGDAFWLHRMIAELLRSLTVRCPPWARGLGLAHEQVAITYRHRRLRQAWASHLDASRAAILEGAARCTARRRAWIVGAGDCLDVPVHELAAQFQEVVLTDVAFGPEIRRLARRSGGRIRAEFWDATGVLPRLARDRSTLTPEVIEGLLADADPGVPSGGEPDLVASANCLSQLGVVPLHRFPGADDDSAWGTRCAAAAARQHLRWLTARTGVRVLLADRARLDLAADGRELTRTVVPGTEALRPPDRAWRWWLAPIPELSPDHHRVHEVGAWIEEGNEGVHTRAAR